MVMEIGPVMHVDDVVGSKVAAVAGRAEVRDYIDLAAALDRYTVAELLTLARRLDPGLTDEDFTDAGRRLDAMTDQRFLHYGLTADEVSLLRQKLSVWPRPGSPMPE